jgi:signal transduction histidine kinase
LLAGVGYEIITASSENEALIKSRETIPDIAIINTSCQGLNTSSLCKNLKLQSQTNDTQIILMTSKDSPSEEVLVGADGYITKPFNENILIATVNAHLRIKRLLDILVTNNTELAKSLYQLNVLFTTSSQLAGTLDKTKLINIMNTGLEKSLNFSLCHALIINEPEDASLIINSQFPISTMLEEALKLRALIGYKTLFENNQLPFPLSIKNIRVEKHFKEKDEGEVLDLNILVWDRLFSPISTSDQFFGTVEIIRNDDFTGEDSNCFQTVVRQVSLPLESALLYEEIKKTNAKLEKLEKLKSEFISIVSHELRTPLTSIKNSLDMMLSGRMGEVGTTQEHFLSLAKRNVDRLSGIINDLLDLSKIEAGKMEYRFEPCNIIEPVKFVVSTFENLAHKKNINLSIECDEEEFKIYGDSNKIEQILSNLISNAIKFTPDNGEVKVIIEKINADSIKRDVFWACPESRESRNDLMLEGDYVKISIQDTGIGIKKEDLPKVFDKFQQIESSLSRKVGGTGLGLPIAMQLVEAHRGKIWIESEFEKGSEFSFIIPLFVQENSFLFELDNVLQKAKYSYSSFALLIIEAVSQTGEKMLQKIADITESIFKDNTCKIFLDKKNIKVILKETDREKTQRLIGTINNYSLESKYSDTEIITGYSIYPEDAITSEELIELAQKSLRVSLK